MIIFIDHTGKYPKCSLCLFYIIFTASLWSTWIMWLRENDPAPGQPLVSDGGGIWIRCSRPQRLGSKYTSRYSWGPQCKFSLSQLITQCLLIFLWANNSYHMIHYQLNCFPVWFGALIRSSTYIGLQVCLLLSMNLSYLFINCTTFSVFEGRLGRQAGHSLGQ